MKTVCILMAAGAGKRFGSNKLLALYRGKPLYQLAMEAIPRACFAEVIVVSGYEPVLAKAAEHGFTGIFNGDPAAGVSRTIRLGLEEAKRLGATAALFMVADQPRLTRESVFSLVADFTEHPQEILSLAFGERRGNPVIFPARFFSELSALEGDCGGSAVIRRHPEALRLHSVTDARELMDVDEAGQLDDEN